jgi:hypothetical protein
MSDATFDTPELFDSARPRRTSWVLPVLLMLAFLVYELTAQPALGVAVACVKFGWNDFCSALWLRRVDPEPRRGRACFWLYLAFGLLKTAITASLLMFAYSFAVGPQIQNAQRNAFRNLPPVEYVVAGATAIGGFMLSGLTAWVALYKAWRGQIRLWLDSSVHQARRQNSWPPRNTSAASPNQARTMVAIALITVCTLFMLVLVPLLIVLGQANQPVAPACMVVGVIVSCGIVLGLRQYLSRGLAKSPSECWGTSVPTSPLQ